MIDDPAFSVAAPEAENGLSTAMATGMGATFTDAGEEDEQREEQTEAVAAAYGGTTAPRFWKEIPLAPFAISREADWRQHRTALGAMPLEDLITQPQALVPDALRVLWFLAHDPAEWLSTPSMEIADAGTANERWVRRTAQAMAMTVERKIRAWADAHISGAEHALAVQVFYDIFNSSQVTKTIVKADKHHSEAHAKN